MKKKIYAGVLSIGLVVGMSACGGSDNDTKTSSNLDKYNLGYIANDDARTAVSSSEEYTSVLVNNSYYLEKKTVSNNATPMTSTEAESYCGSLDYSNGGWRLPNKSELATIMDLSSILNFEESEYDTYTFYQESDGNIDTTYDIPRTVAESLGGYGGAPSKNYVVCARTVGDTSENAEDKLSENDKMVVKLSETSEELADNSEECSALLYKDLSLNLILAQERTEAAFGQKKNWSDASAYCNNLDYMNYKDWRLPTTEETDIMAYYYEDNSDEIISSSGEKWSSTTYASNYSYYYSISSTYSSSYHNSKKLKFMCVRTNN